MIGKPEDIIEWLYQQEEDKEYEIKEYKSKRSLNANAYCWTLIGKIARELSTTKEEIYRNYIYDFGVYDIITLKNEAVNKFIKAWRTQGLGWICEISEQREDYADIIIYYGTSSYNTKQMSQFIDNVVQDAKNLSIETLPPYKIEEIKRMWENEQKNSY